MIFTPHPLSLSHKHVEKKITLCILIQVCGHTVFSGCLLWIFVHSCRDLCLPHYPAWVPASVRYSCTWALSSPSPCSITTETVHKQHCHAAKDPPLAKGKLCTGCVQNCEYWQAPKQLNRSGGTLLGSETQLLVQSLAQGPDKQCPHTVKD